MSKLFALAFAAVIISCNSADKTIAEKKEKDKYEQTKETLEETEKKNPKRFLSVELDKDKKNLIGQLVVKGEVKNNAKVAAYKDVEIEISYYSKTGAFLMSSNDVVYDVIKPGESASFKNKEFAPKGTDSVGLKIVGAKVD
ncbi:MAG: hypothetical protein KA319_10655 [Ferruginibacter sp.]|nr:hypothetical protein [Ferruginibacter sp.]